MSNFEPIKCIYCGKISMYELPPEGGTDYVLTTINRNTTPPTYNTSSIPIKLYGCTECNGIHIVAPSLKKK
ncbi:MAG: hypothetical protein UHU19_07145 [Lachnospiraceae bacterium]|nr:hypothetical protein [Lachnospiraceae bacterium]